MYSPDPAPLRRRRVPDPQTQARPRAQQSPGHGQADAATGSGDHDDPAGKWHHRTTPLIGKSSAQQIFGISVYLSTSGYLIKRDTMRFSESHPLRAGQTVDSGRVKTPGDRQFGLPEQCRSLRAASRSGAPAVKSQCGYRCPRPRAAIRNRTGLFGAVRNPGPAVRPVPLGPYLWPVIQYPA